MKQQDCKSWLSKDNKYIIPYGFNMRFKKEWFPITQLSRQDIKMCGFTNIDVDSITDEQMENIVKKMQDSYIENSFWIDLEICAKEVLG